MNFPIKNKYPRFRGNYPVGVTDRKYKSGTVKYVTMVNEYGNNKYFGTYSTPLEAFVVYKKEKERYIKEVANLYKNKFEKFPQKLYNAMMEYEVFKDD